MNTQVFVEGKAKEKKTPWVKLIFMPSLFDRLKGKKDVVIKRQLDPSVLKYESPPVVKGSKSTKAK